MMFSRAARRAGGTEPSRVIPSAPAVQASASGLSRKATGKFIMSPLMRLNNHWSANPSSNPKPPPTQPIPAASASTMRRMNRRPAPIARSTPISRRRSVTDSVNVLSRATAATATTMIHTALAMNMLWCSGACSPASAARPS